MELLEANQTIARIDASAEHLFTRFGDGGNMRWRVFGPRNAQPPLVLVHGGHGSWLHWIRNIEPLAHSHRLFVPDLPGFGDSDSAPVEAGVQYLSDAMIASLDQLFGSSTIVNLAGFSLGGVVSAHVAVRRGAVQKLALLGSPGSETPHRRSGEMMRWRDADGAAQEAALRHNLLRHMMRFEKNADALAYRAYADPVKATRFRSSGIGGAIPLREILQPYTAPILFLYGEHDVICTPVLARTRLSNADLQRECRVIPESGHWVPFERADAVNDALVRWCGGSIPTLLLRFSRERARPRDIAVS